MINYLINKLKAQIDEHIANGGSIYDERRTLPYYDNMRYLKDKLKATNPDITIESIYALCGYTLDREYHRFELFNDELSKASDINLYVDAIKSNHNHLHTRNVLNMLSKELGCSPSDYLVLMTKYRYRKAIVQGDYVSQLQEELSEAYPDGNTTGMKRQNKQLYNKLRHFAKYAPENISMSDALTFFGLNSDGYSDTPLTQEQCEIIKKDFKEKYDPSTIDQVKDFDYSDYIRLNRVALRENIAVYDLLIKLGYSVKSHSNVPQLSRLKVDAKEREDYLLATRREMVGELIKRGESIPQDSRELYYFNKKLASMVIDKIYNLDMEK